MARWASYLAAICFGFGLAAAQAASTEDGRPALDMSNAQAIVDVLAEPDKALAADPDVALPLWQKLDGDAKRFRPPNQCDTFLTLAAPMPGIVLPHIRLSPSADCSQAKKGSANLLLVFKNAGDQQAFRDKLIERFGPSDAKCSNDKTAFWSLKPGYSLRWNVGYAQVAVLALVGADPQDANCTVSSVREDPLLGQLVSQAQITALLRRVKDNPPPWTDCEAMGRWLTDYGQPEQSPANSADSNSAGQCSQFFVSPARQGTGVLPGIAALSAIVGPAGGRGDASSAPASLYVSAIGTDMFAETKFRNALREVFGAPVAACHDELKDVWQISDSMTALLLPDMDPLMFSILALPLRDLDCGK